MNTPARHAQTERNRRVALTALVITLFLLVTPGAVVAGMVQALQPILDVLRQWKASWWPWPSTNLDSAALALDKIIHFLLFAVCGVLVARAWVSGSGWLLPIVFLLAFGALTELIQYLVPGRSMSFADFVADALGAMTGFAGWYCHTRLKRRRG